MSPSQVGDEVEVLRTAPQKECRCDMFVMIRWGTPERKERVGVPPSQLEVIRGSESVRQAVEDWHYWVDRGYEF